MSERGNIQQAFQSSISVMRSTCGLVRLVPDYQPAVLSFQLVLKLAEILDANVKILSCLAAASSNSISLRSFVPFQTSAEGSETLKEKFLEDLRVIQQHLREWRDELLQKPLMIPSRSLSYPKEIEVKCSGCLVLFVRVDGDEESVRVEP